MLPKLRSQTRFPVKIFKFIIIWVQNRQKKISSPDLIAYPTECNGVLDSPWRLENSMPKQKHGQDSFSSYF